MAALLRTWGTFDYPELVGDESINVTLAKDTVKYGVGDWKYSPLNSLVIASTIKIFGDNPVGWRINGIVLGTACVLLVFLIAKRLFAERFVPIVAASLLAFDPFHIHFCRTTIMETPVIFFFLLYLYLMLEYCENDRQTLSFAGIALGLTIATKAYFVFAIPVIACYAFYRKLNHDKKNGAYKLSVEFIVKLALLPISIYLLSHAFWFARGHTLPELFLLKSDAYWVFSHNFTFDSSNILLQGGKPWEWFIKPFSFGHQLSGDGQFGRFAIQINNPLFRLMVLPALIIVIFTAIKKQRIQEMLAPSLFASCYLLFFMAKRTMNSYSSLVLLPFAYLMLAKAIISISHKYNCDKETTIIFLCAVFVSGCYLFPIAAGFQVPVALYEPILSFSKITKVF
jgi:dolichyl-phosphate-mannose--protein O-mannosyl transferase